jgi:hypothetical protein
VLCGVGTMPGAVPVVLSAAFTYWRESSSCKMLARR